MILPRQYSKVLNHNYEPEICLRGKWLKDLGFNVNSLVKIECTDKKLKITICPPIEDDLKFLLQEPSLYEDPQHEVNLSERFEGFSWLDDFSKKDKRLSKINNSLTYSRLLSSTVYDLLYVLLDLQLLKEDGGES